MLELMIVVAIIGILAAIAFPSYQNQMTESRREDAHVALLRMASEQEKFYLQNNEYADTGDEASVGGTATEHGWYTIAITNGDASSFSLTATATETGAQAGDAGCTALTINQAGQKLPASCW